MNPTTPTITADGLNQDLKPLSLAPNTTPSVSSYIDELTKSMQGLQDKADTSAADFTKLLAEPGSAAYEQALAETSGLNETNKQLGSVQTQLDALDAQNIYSLNEISNKARGTLETSQFLDAGKAALSERIAMEKAPLLYKQATLTRGAEAAQSFISGLVKVKAEQDKARLDIARTNLERNYDLLDTADKRIADLKIKEIDTAQKAIEDLTDEQTSTAKLIAANGAPASVIGTVMNAKSIADIYKDPAIAKYLSDPLDRSYKQLQIRKLQQELADGSDTTGTQDSIVYANKPTELLSRFFDRTGIKSDTSIDNAAAVVAATEQFANRNSDGNFRGIGFLAKGFFTGKGDERKTNKADIAGLNLKVQQWASGASLTKQQEKYVARMVPDKNDSDRKVQAKLNALTNYMLADVQGRVAAKGEKLEYMPVDFFGEEVKADNIAPAINNAVASGFDTSEIMTYVSENYPQYSALIDEAKSNGYSEEEILSYLTTAL